MIFTNATAKRDFYLIHFGIKMSPTPRHTQRLDVLGVKIAMSSYPVSCQLRQAVCFAVCLQQHESAIAHI